MVKTLRNVPLDGREVPLSPGADTSRTSVHGRAGEGDRAPLQLMQTLFKEMELTRLLFYFFKIVITAHPACFNLLALGIQINPVRM